MPLCHILADSLLVVSISEQKGASVSAHVQSYLLVKLVRTKRPGQNRSRQADLVPRCNAFYCVGSIICVKPIVLMVRSIGVSGGSKLGVKKLVSNW